MKTIFLIKFFSISLLLLPLPSFAKIFRNSYISFELPTGWSCSNKKANIEWVCYSQNSKVKSSRKKEAIVMLTAKEAGPLDNFKYYENYLNNPLKTLNAKTTTSKVVDSVQQRRINNHLWIHGFHLGSAAGSYYTRYLVTVRNKLAIVVTFSAHRKYYSTYSKDFAKMMKSLRVVAPKNFLSQVGQGSFGSISKPVIGPSLNKNLGNVLGADGVGNQAKKNTNKEKILNLLALFFISLAFIIMYIFLKKRKKKKKN